MAIISTALDLFRTGNTTEPKRLDYFRSGEIVTSIKNGIEWVCGPKQGGASMFDAPIGRRGTWYVLPKGTGYNDLILFVWNDYAKHWSLEPAKDMPLTVYANALKILNTSFNRVP
jgi:hypothetical protein